MLANEYFKYAIKKGYLNKLNWYYSVFTLQTDDTKYTKIENGKQLVLIDDRYEPIEDIKTKAPILTMASEITIDGDYLDNLDKPIKTTIGRVIINKILLSDVFGNKIPYINERTSIGAIEKMIAKGMYNNDLIEVSEYKRFADVVGFLQGLSRITTVSATEKSLLPPDGLDKFKKDLKSEFDKKYGPDWTKDRSIIVEYEKRLRDFDAEWMKGEPNDGFLIGGKVKNVARTKMYLDFGAEAGFDTTGSKVDLVDNSLLDGYPKDKEKLATMYNTSRAGSYDRGKETQKGGAAAKDMLRATSSTTITHNDCKSNEGKEIFVTKDIADGLIGRYIIKNGKSEPIDDPTKYIGKSIIIRSPQYCLEKGNSLCSVCVGDVMKKYDKGINLVITELSGTLLYISMQSMHGKVLSTMDFDLIDNIV